MDTTVNKGDEISFVIHSHFDGRKWKHYICKMHNALDGSKFWREKLSLEESQEVPVGLGFHFKQNQQWRLHWNHIWIKSQGSQTLFLKSFLTGPPPYHKRDVSRKDCEIKGLMSFSSTAGAWEYHNVLWESCWIWGPWTGEWCTNKVGKKGPEWEEKRPVDDSSLAQAVERASPGSFSLILLAHLHITQYMNHFSFTNHISASLHSQSQAYKSHTLYSLHT